MYCPEGLQDCCIFNAKYSLATNPGLNTVAFWPPITNVLECVVTASISVRSAVTLRCYLLALLTQFSYVSFTESLVLDACKVTASNSPRPKSASHLKHSAEMYSARICFLCVCFPNYLLQIHSERINRYSHKPSLKKNQLSVALFPFHFFFY